MTSKTEAIAAIRECAESIRNGGQFNDDEILDAAADMLEAKPVEGDDEGSWKATHEYCEKQWQEERAAMTDKISSLRDQLTTARSKADALDHIAEMVGEKDDPFAAWEVVDHLKRQTKKTDPGRALKDALFTCLKAGLTQKSYGGVLVDADAGTKAWVTFDIVGSTTSAIRVELQKVEK